jgi:hypothetical protein
LLLYRPEKHRNMKGFRGKFNHPWAKLQAGRFITSAAEKSDKPPMSAAQFQRIGWREFVLEQGTQPI